MRTNIYFAYHRTLVLPTRGRERERESEIENARERLIDMDRERADITMMDTFSFVRVCAKRSWLDFLHCYHHGKATAQARQIRRPSGREASEALAGYSSAQAEAPHSIYRFVLRSWRLHGLLGASGSGQGTFVGSWGRWYPGSHGQTRTRLPKDHLQEDSSIRPMLYASEESLPKDLLAYAWWRSSHVLRSLYQDLGKVLQAKHIWILTVRQGGVQGCGCKSCLLVICDQNKSFTSSHCRVPTLVFNWCRSCLLWKIVGCDRLDMICAATSFTASTCSYLQLYVPLQQSLQSLFTEFQSWSSTDVFHVCCERLWAVID